MSKTKVSLDQRVITAIDKYKALGGFRNREGLEVFMHRGLSYVTLPCVNPELKMKTINANHLFIMWDVYIDDIIDTKKDKSLTNIMLANALNKNDDDLAKIKPEDREWFTTYLETWEAFNNYVKSFPRYNDFADILHFDIVQFLNCIRYSLLIHEYPQLININEHELYISHNVNCMIFATVNLMCSDNFNMDDLSILRKILWEAQYMCRIDNDMATWEREASQGDFDSSIFTLAIEKKILDYKELFSGKYNDKTDELIDIILKSDIINELTLDWKSRKTKIAEYSKYCKSVDIEAYMDGLEKLQELFKKSKNIL
ncbi:MAG: hypothetical protein GY754_21015 [bacterium]|nr:hypothetical protein [bacterium]